MTATQLVPTNSKLAEELAIFVSQHSEYRWHRTDLALYQSEIAARAETTAELNNLAAGRIARYFYQDYLWDASFIHRVTDSCYVVTTRHDSFQHNQQLTDDLQQRIAGVFKGWSRPLWDNPKIGDREVRRLGRVQPVRVRTSILFSDPGTWYAIGPDCIFFMKDRYDSPFLAGRFTVFMSPTGGKYVHGQPHLAISSASERELARYLELAKHVNDNVRASAERGTPDHGTFWLGR